MPVNLQCAPVRSDLISTNLLVSEQTLLVDRIRLALLRRYNINDNPAEWDISRYVSPYPIRLDSFGVALCEHGLINENGYLTLQMEVKKTFIVDYAHAFKQLAYGHLDDLIPYGYMDILSYQGFFSRYGRYEWATKNRYEEQCDLITNEDKSTCLREMSFTYPMQR